MTGALLPPLIRLVFVRPSRCGELKRLTCFFFALCAWPMADAFLCFLYPAVAVVLLVDQAAAVDTVVLEVTVAHDG